MSSPPFASGGGLFCLPLAVASADDLAVVIGAVSLNNRTQKRPRLAVQSGALYVCPHHGRCDAGLLTKNIESGRPKRGLS